MESKADSTFPVVGAASIVAKQLRDHLLRDVMGVSSASGYPGDQSTVKWLHDNIDRIHGFPPVVRFSWSTASLLMDQKCCPVKWLDSLEEDPEKGKKRDHRSVEDPKGVDLLFKILLGPAS